MKVFNSKMWRIASAVAIFLAFSQGASAQPFLRKYNKITEKNLPKFITSWESWSDSLACEAKGEDLNALTKQVNKDISEEEQSLLDEILFRISSVKVSRGKKYVLMNVPTDKVQDVVKVLPGAKSPTVMPLATDGWSSIHTVIDEKRFWEIIRQLKDLGAQGILVVPIEKMIL